VTTNTGGFHDFLIKGKVDLGDFGLIVDDRPTDELVEIGYLLK